MRTYRWNEHKNEQLKESRGISFEDIVLAIESGGLIDVLSHPNQEQYPNQKVLVVAVMEYVYLVPHVEEYDHLFLKTIIPSRKATRDYGRRGDK
ncbi:MAG: toxin [Nitrospira sp. CR1.1]|nr:toxin [Nitrospira sp. CR1.1]